MFTRMFHRLRRPVIYLMVAAQLLLSAPMANAFDRLAQGDGLPCMEQMAAATDGSDCPCCPDGSQSLAGCLSACLTSAAVAPTILASASPAEYIEIRGTDITEVIRSGEAPLKPPPIA
jgi:hypothetical protein